MLKLVPPLEVVLGSARMDLGKSFREMISQGCRASPFCLRYSPPQRVESWQLPSGGSTFTALVPINANWWYR